MFSPLQMGQNVVGSGTQVLNDQEWSGATYVVCVCSFGGILVKQ